MDSAYYRTLRRLAAQEVEEAPAFSDLVFSIKEIDRAALDAHEAWGRADGNRRRVDWDWPGLVERYRRCYNNRLDMAIWDGDVLCGLALGRVSAGKLVVRVCYVEGSPDVTSLSGNVFAVVDLYLEAYAVHLEIDTIALQDPFEEVVSHYEDFGYVRGDPFDPRNNAMTRSLARD